MIALGLLLGLICVTPFVVTYVLIIRWCDRFEPEPWWLLICAFVWGALFATMGGGVSSGIGEGIAMAITGVSDVQDEGIQAFGATVLAPIFEEGFKGIGVALIAGLSAMGLKELDGPLDGAIYGGIVGLGFTLTEDILYVSRQFAEAGLPGFAVLLFVRTVLLGLSHCTFTACTGLGFGIAAASKSKGVKLFAPLVGWGTAMLMHAVHNGLPTLGGGMGTAVMIVGSWVIDMAYFAILGMLVTRERRIIIRELLDEVGSLLSVKELPLLTSYFQLARHNWRYFMDRGPRAYNEVRKKQEALIALAFVKARRQGTALESSYRAPNADLGAEEQKLRTFIANATARGVVIE